MSSIPMTSQAEAGGEREISDAAAQATRQQRLASDPLVSSWVGASAGSGKTKVLTDRILRLLLPNERGNGAAPEKILALTFTKAGANEMALRLSKRLSAWATMDEAALRGDMDKNLLGHTPSDAEMAAARKLFARTVETAGGLRIMTIHSFCQSVLARFPIEAGLLPGFKPLEDNEIRELLSLAQAETIAAAGRDPSAPEAEAIATLSAALNEAQFAQLVKGIVSERQQLEKILRVNFGPDGLYTSLCRSFAIPPGTTLESATKNFCADPRMDLDGLREACRLMVLSTSKDAEKAVFMQGFLERDEIGRPEYFSTYCRGFLTAKGELYKTGATATLLKKHPQIEDILRIEGERILNHQRLCRKLSCIQLTQSVFVLAHAVNRAYQILKEKRGALDFDDMIYHTLSLFTGTQNSRMQKDPSLWVMYKLDEGIDHILVDEAQDTNPEQWEIVRYLTGEFFTDIGARESPRTVFVVGDDKQSIFSFQRAAPEKFFDMRAWFANQIAVSGGAFRNVDITTSFRSVQAILHMVDRVFGTDNAAYVLSKNYLTHHAKRQGQAGSVELWPLLIDDAHLEDGEAAEEETVQTNFWDVPDKVIDLKSGSQKLADKIGDTIKSWLTQKQILSSYARPVRPGDIMILVRSRTAFVNQLIRALKYRNIPVSGIDRMRLLQELVVQDLCAAARFALLPEDDLSLACLLKSPLIGLSEEDLYTYAHGRTRSLWDVIRNSDRHDLVSWLENLIHSASLDKPYDFFAKIVQGETPSGQESGIKAIYARLGEDAMDPLDEFINLTLMYEDRGACTSLEGFLAAHADSDAEIKRELEEASGAVRIMTVHASKGLQAPIVFLPDTVLPKNRNMHLSETVLWPQKTGQDLPLYVTGKADMPEEALSAYQTIMEKEQQEYRRLLYVGMTRAEERLYVAGFSKKAMGATRDASWYSAISDAFKSFEGDERLIRLTSGIADENGVDIPILRLFEDAMLPPDKNSAEAEIIERDTVAITLPAWIKAQKPLEPDPPRPLVPSRPSDDEPAALSPLQARNAYRFRRGLVTHKLLQVLPDLPVENRRAAAQSFLESHAQTLPQEVRDEILAETIAILEDPVFGDVFAAHSIAEVPVTGLVDGQILSGQIDRLVVRKDEVLIVDYKTNRPSPDAFTDVSAAYKRQVSLYKAALSNIYPGKKIRAGLLWTDSARLMEIPSGDE